MILPRLVAHPRKLIRHYIVAQLIAANTAAGARVVPTRIDRNRKQQLPAISVFTLREPVDTDKTDDTAPVRIYRDVKVEIVAWVGHSEDYTLDDRMDDIAEQIEAMMANDRYLGGRENGLAERALLENTEMALPPDGADPHVGIIALTYSVKYQTVAAIVAVDEFLRAHVKTRFPGVEDANAAVDDINVRPS